MKVFDLHCARGHVFEGWFASELDFLSQSEHGFVTCPVCADASITKMISAPRLNLMTSRNPSASPLPESPVESESVTAQAQWLALVRDVMEHTDDVGVDFPEEARKIHYGEAASRPIRGHASLEQTASLIEEGIAVVPLFLPEAFKGQLQ